MGFNTPVLILNDAADGLKTDTQFGPRLLDAMSEANRSEYRDHGKSVVLGHHGNGAYAFAAQHADDVQVIAFGGNCMTSLGMVYGGWSQMTDPDKLMRSLAQTLGYRLVKLPGRA